MSLRGGGSGSMYSAVSSVTPLSVAARPSVSNADRVSSLLKKRPMDRKLRKTYFKLEDSYQKYQPIIHETEYWPRIDLDTPHGYCPFICSTEEHKERIQLYEDLEREKRQEQHTKKTPKEGPSADKVKIRRNITYCECCKMHISSLDEHLQSEEHNSYVTNEDNYREVKQMMKEMNKKGDSLLHKYFQQQQKLKRQAKETVAANTQDGPSNKENIPLQQNERQGQPCTSMKQGKMNKHIISQPSSSVVSVDKESFHIQEAENERKLRPESGVGNANEISLKDVDKKSVDKKSVLTDSRVRDNIKSMAGSQTGFATASVIYKSEVEEELEMREEKQRRLCHVEKLKNKSGNNSRREHNLLNAEPALELDDFCRKTESENCSRASNSQYLSAVDRNCESDISNKQNFEKQRKSVTPPFKKVCAKLFKSPAPYEFSLENFGIKLTPSPNIACVKKSKTQNISQPISDDSYKYLDPSPEIFAESIRMEVPEKNPDAVSSIMTCEFAQTLKDASFDVNLVSDKLKVVKIDSKSTTTSSASTVTPPRSKRPFADIIVLSSDADGSESENKTKSRPTLQLKRMKLEDMETRVVDEDVTFFTPRSGITGEEYSACSATTASEINSSSDKSTTNAGGTAEFNSKCTTPSLLTGRSSPATLLGRSCEGECPGDDMETADTDSDEMLPSPVIGSKSRSGKLMLPTRAPKCEDMRNTATTERNDAESQQSLYVEGFYPLGGSAEEDAHPGRSGRDYSRKSKKFRDKAGRVQECDNSEVVIRRTSRKRTARGKSCSQSDGDETTGTPSNTDTTIDARITDRANRRCQSNTPKFNVLAEVQLQPTTPTPNLDALSAPNSNQSSQGCTSALKETLKMKRVRKICRKLNSGAQNSDVKHFDHLIQKVLGCRL